MELITLPRLRLNQLQTLSENTLEICENLNEIAPAITQTKVALEAFKKGMLKDKALAAGKKTMDNTRDRLISGLMYSIKAEEVYPYEDVDIQNTSKKLVQTVNKYGGKISRLPLHEETAAIDNLIADVAQLNLASFESPAVTRWIPLLEKANSNFKVATKDYIEDSVEASNIESASSLVPALTDALEGLYTMMFAHLKLSANGQMEKAYSEIHKLVDSFR